jgi:hypothetical protein
MATLKNRIEQAEDRQWLESRKRLLAAFNGRSMADLEFFVAHGYLPEIPIPGTPVDTSEWPVRSRAEVKRLLAGRSEEDKEFFCANGYWPTEGGERRNGDS